MSKLSRAARSRARELAVQALYQAEITAHDSVELLRQFRERDEYADVEQAYFEALITGICDGKVHLVEVLGRYTDRPVEQLDPVELAILLVGCYELESREDVPFRTVVNEAVDLAKRFGAEDGYKFVNAVLDRAARGLRDVGTD